MSKHWSAVILMIAVSVVAPGLTGIVVATLSVAGESTEAGGFSTIGSAELADRLNGKDFVFINVHIPYEGEIAATDAFIPFDKIEESLG